MCVRGGVHSFFNGSEIKSIFGDEKTEISRDKNESKRLKCVRKRKKTGKI